MFRRMLALVPAALLVALAGCSTDTNLGGVAVPNARPDTRITGQPPTLLEASFVVTFNWTGADPDGRIVGFQWKISDNGTDGISPRDTLTYDPLTGAELNPWHFTTATDSSFVVLSDQPDFPGDVASPRSFRSHSLFVRAVDDKGAVDPTPAYMSFTSTTIVPTARVVWGGSGLLAKTATTAPPKVNVGWSGTDPDFELRVPTKVRYLWRTAHYDDGTPEGLDIISAYHYNQFFEELVDFSSPDWSTWRPYGASEDVRRTAFRDLEDQSIWLFAVQTQDTAGAVSVGRAYAQQVANLRVYKGFKHPALTVVETYLGQVSTNSSPEPLPAGRPLKFAWSGDAGDYNGIITSYRHGWDLVDVNDPNDPGWAVPPGMGEQNRESQERSFDDGAHTFWVRVTDDSQQTTDLRFRFTIVPFVDYDRQSELLVLDQTVDEDVQNWPDRSGQPRNEQQFRDAFWQFLQSQPGGVDGLDWNLDHIGDHDKVGYEDLVNYKAVLCYAQANKRQSLFQQLRPVKVGENYRDQYVWLEPYQRRGGNFFLVGGASMESTLQMDPHYMTPVIFDTRETTYPSGNISYTVGFGTRELPDGTEVQRGPEQYPYLIGGISAIDWTASSTKYIYGKPEVPYGAMSSLRKSDCVGVKAVVLDSLFAEHWAVGPGAIADTIGTEPIIDWQDDWFDQLGKLSIVQNKFWYANDELINANISTTRSTLFYPQDCSDPNAPNGECVEPMFRGQARFDWLRERMWARGDATWPHYQGQGVEGEDDEGKAMDDTCGSLALAPYSDPTGQHASLPRGTARTNGKVFGYVSYKMTADKPSHQPDVYWGFDPYRFDQEQSKKAIRWVLRNIFSLNVLDE